MATDKSKLRATPEEEDFRGKYESGRIGDFLLGRYFEAVEYLFDLTKLRKARALEIGCGEGLSTKRLAEMLPKGVALEASEYVQRQVTLARKNNPGIKVIQESAYELERPDDSLDLVFLLEVLEHLDFPSKALQEIKRVLRPGGYLIIGVPFEPLWRMLNMARGKYWHDLGNTPGHLNHWSSRSLRRLLATQSGEVTAARNPIPWTLLLVKNTDV